MMSSGVSPTSQLPQGERHTVELSRCLVRERKCRMVSGVGARRPPTRHTVTEHPHLCKKKAGCRPRPPLLPPSSFSSASREEVSESERTRLEDSSNHNVQCQPLATHRTGYEKLFRKQDLSLPESMPQTQTYFVSSQRPESQLCKQQR